MISISALIAGGIPPTQAKLFADPLLLACSRFDISSTVRQAAFVAQTAHESAMFTRLEESLFYRSADRIAKVFRSNVNSIDEAQRYVEHPQALANHVYSHRNGNGDEASGDGWRYRGRGLMQLTGRANYALAGNDIGRPYEGRPDLLQQPEDAALSAGWFWAMRGCNQLADASNIDAITRRINGSAMLGAAERRQLFDDLARVF